MAADDDSEREDELDDDQLEDELEGELEGGDDEGELEDEEELELDDDEDELEAKTLREWLGGAPLGRSYHQLLGFGLPALLCVLNAWRMRGHTVDDAYISFRYARHFAEGSGLVYNVGERIEGYTNFLWTVLLGLAIRLGLDPVVTAKVLGAGCGVATLAAVYAISQHLRPLTIVPCLATWLLASTMVFTGHAVFGLETTLFTALVTVGTWRLLVEEAETPPRQDWRRWVPWSGLLFAAAGLTRPEAPMYLGLGMLFLAGKPLWPSERLADEDVRATVLFGGFLVGALAFGLSRVFVQSAVSPWGMWLSVAGMVAVIAALPRRLFSPRNLVRGALFVAPVAAHVAWRKSFYGSWLPNTLAAKTGNLQQQLGGGTDYARRFVDHEGPLLYLALFGIGAAIAWRHRELLSIGAVVLCGFVYVVLVGGDWMVLFRFFTPVLPFLYLLIGIAARTIFEQRSRAFGYGMLLLAVVGLAHRGAQTRDDIRAIFGEWKEKHFWDAAAGGVVRWFHQQEQSRGRDAVMGTIALGDIGQIGYETGYPVLDLLGLVDPVIAKLPGGYTTKIGPGFRDRFFDAEPRYFILISSDGDCVHPSVIGSRILFHDPRFHGLYTVRGRVPLNQGFSWCVYEHARFGGEAR